MRVLVCGGRDFSDTKLLNEVLHYFDVRYDFTTMIHGGARGADQMAGEWADYCGQNRMHVEVYPADWDTYGKAAGWIRNKRMLKEGKPDLVIAFPGGKGTANMVKIAREAGVEVVEVNGRICSIS